MSKFCINCGNQAADNARVCGYCGNAFSDAEVNQQPEMNYNQPEQYYQPQVEYLQPAPKKSKKGIIIAAVAAIAVIVIALVVILGGGGPTKNGAEKKSPKDIATQAAEYLSDADAEGLAKLTSDLFARYLITEAGYDLGDVDQDEMMTRFYEGGYTDYVDECMDDGMKITFKIKDYEESDELGEIQEEYGDSITAIYLYEAIFYFEDTDGYIDEEDLAIIVWENDGVWEFVTFD